MNIVFIGISLEGTGGFMFIRGEVKGSVRDSVMEYNKEDDVIVTDFKDKCLTER